MARGVAVHNELTPTFERDGDGYIACCPQIPGAKTGRSKTLATVSLPPLAQPWPTAAKVDSARRYQMPNERRRS